jgi:hypothetical protein
VLNQTGISETTPEMPGTPGTTSDMIPGISTIGRTTTTTPGDGVGTVIATLTATNDQGTTLRAENTIQATTKAISDLWNISSAITVERMRTYLKGSGGKPSKPPVTYTEGLRQLHFLDSLAHSNTYTTPLQNSSHSALWLRSIQTHPKGSTHTQESRRSIKNLHDARLCTPNNKDLAHLGFCNK